jgi:hypothetical protein
MPRPQKKPAARAAPARERVTLTWPPELLKRIDALAQREDPPSKVVEMAMRKYVEDAAV